MLVSTMNGKRTLDFAVGEGPLTKKARINGLDQNGKKHSNGGFISVENDFIVRRMANVKAQMALASFYSISESPTKINESYIFSGGKGEVLACGDMESVSASLHNFTTKADACAQTPVLGNKVMHPRNGRHTLRSSPQLIDLPESPMSSVVSEEETPSNPAICMLQNGGALKCEGNTDTDDECMKQQPVSICGTVGRGKQSLDSKKKSSNDRQLNAPLPPSLMDYKTGYVQRLASLNARACVTALIESERRFIPKSRREPPSQGVMSKKSTATRLDSPSRRQDQSPAPQEVKTSKRNTPDVELRPFSVGIVKCKSPQLQEDDLDKIPFNTLGLLYNGDTIHPQYPFYLDSNFQVPDRILPVVVPSTVKGGWEAGQLAREQFRQSKRRLRATKGNNGWTTIGESIKSIEYAKEGTVHSRKYFAGIRRRNEEIFVRDCVTIRSGGKKNDRPYVAKVASIWQEPGGFLMLGLFWYYRPADIPAANFPPLPDELFASQHHDDNSVACIVEKCFVLGLRAYCRYHASTFRKRVVPELKSLVKFNSNCEVVLPKGPPVGTDSALIYVSYQGFNHITGKVAR